MKISTEDVPQSLRLELWMDLVCAHLVQVECAGVVDGDRFHGQITKTAMPRLEVAQIQAGGQVARRTARQLANSLQDVVLINIQRSGRSRMTQGRNEAILDEGDLAFYCSDRPYELCFQSDFHQTVLMLPKSSLPGLCGLLETHSAVAIRGSDPSARLLMRLADAVSDCNNLGLTVEHLLQETVLQTVSSLAAGFSGKFTEREALQQHHLARARQYALENISNPQLNVAQIANGAGISVSHLHRLMSKQAQTLMEWVWDVRLLRSRAELASAGNGCEQISDIASRNGFLDMSHFSRAYRRRFGHSPTDTRRLGLPANKIQSPAALFVGPAGPDADALAPTAH